MKIFFRNEKGVALISVIIVTAVILLFGTILVEASVQGLKLTKHSRNIDFARYAGDTSIENWFYKIEKKASDEDFIKTVLSDPSYPIPANETEAMNLAIGIVDELKKDLNVRQFIDISATLSESNNLEINGTDIQGLGELQGLDYDAGDVITGFSEVRIATITDAEGNKSLAVQAVGADFDASENILTVIIGITVNALYSDGVYSTDNRIIYAEKEFEFKIPDRSIFELEYAILTLGDLYANNVEGNVKGDVNVFGTFPNITGDPKQHYYGGIYAINNAKLNLMGNAYTRSFIRTGDYKPRAFHNPADGAYSATDGSAIHVYKDAIAQNIQLFGNDSEIATYRNAYTFVDLEINSERSILFVNGSFVGLTKGQGHINTPHDNLSGIVNSAVIHNLLSEDSQKSRIFIGGDVVVPGGTIRIDPEDGTGVGQIEDASAAWWESFSGKGPFYRLWDDDKITENPDLYAEELMRTYRELHAGDYLGGHTNIFQDSTYRVNIKENSNWFNSGFYTNESLKNAIANGIASLRGLSINEAKNNKTGVITNITGAWTYPLAANGGLYEYGDNDYAESRTNFQFLNDSNYILDNIFYESGDLKYGSGFWNISSRTDAGFAQDVWGKLNSHEDDIIVDDLYYRSQPFITRSYEEGSGWAVGERNSTHYEGISLFNEIIKEINGINSAIGANEHFIVVTGDDDVILPNESIKEDEYYFVFDTRGNKNIIVNGDFNGIIFSTGTVILEGGANVKGSIITAGGGTGIPGESFEARSKYGIDINDATLANLDSGEYAGVVFEENAGGDINVDFYLGLSPEDVLGNAGFSGDEYILLNKAARINLLNKLKENGINLESVF